MRHGSLFSGIGGFDLAAEWMGWENVFHCEWNEFGQKVLKHYWPKSISYADICSTDFTIHRGNIDILTGGFPCQPYSAAGKRLGKEDDRHLWPEMLRAIREIQPKWVVGENVLGLVNWSGGLVFHEVQTDLEAQGYEVFPYVLPAASVGAPHRRDRIWFVAYSKSAGAGSDIGGVRSVFNGYNQRKEDESLVAYAKLCSNRLPTTGGVDMERTLLEGREWGKKADGFGIVSTDGNATNTNSDGFNQRNGKHEEQSSEGGFDAFSNIDKGDDNGNAADTEGEQSERVRFKFGESCEQEQEQSGGNGSEVGCERNAANPNSIGQRGQADWIGESEFNGKNCKRDDWANFPTQSPICSRNDGISSRLDSITFPKWRNESIKAAGNAICPQVVYQIFKAIEQYEQLP